MEKFNAYLKKYEKWGWRQDLKQKRTEAQVGLISLLFSTSTLLPPSKTGKLMFNFFVPLRRRSVGPIKPVGMSILCIAVINHIFAISLRPPSLPFPFHAVYLRYNDG